MKFTYRMHSVGSGWLAECVESDAMGEGKTERDAVQSLRACLEERMFRPDAIAPPAQEVDAAIELELAIERTTRDALDLGGPGG